MIKVRIGGLGSFSKRVSACRLALKNESKDALLQSAEDLKAAARERFLPEAAQVGNSDRPVSRSGRLAGSVSVRHSEQAMRAEVGTNLDYGRYLEFGTQKMTPRPWLGPALSDVRAGFRVRLREALKQTLQGK